MPMIQYIHLYRDDFSLLLLYGCTTWTLKSLEKKLDGNYTNKDVACCFEQILEAASYKIPGVPPFFSHLVNHPNKTIKICLPLLEKQGQTHKKHSPMYSNTWTHQCWLTSKTYIY